MAASKRRPEGIVARHRRHCESHVGGACVCRPTYQAQVFSPRDRKTIEQALAGKVLPALGHLRLSSVTRGAVQDLADRLVANGLAPSTVCNAVLPLRAIYRRAIARSEVLVNPTLGLALPAVRGRRDRVAPAREAWALLDARPELERPLWATALYAGLRRGELQALRWRDVDFERASSE
jgi:integrase